MKKMFRKILPSFLLTAIIVISGGFADGMMANAQMGSMNANLYMSGEMTHYVANGPILHQQDVPAGNSLKPCCQDKQGGASAVQTSIFSQGVKFLAIDSAQVAFDNNSVFKNTLTELSSASPPKPDVLFSVLKKE
ncbi:MAG: hypothetical protein ACD_8C00070G0001 [uncultured bacterium]|nr:MAG: hypothetical protein ACD_8C00070G0001 [uncultured bacterium]